MKIITHNYHQFQRFNPSGEKGALSRIQTILETAFSLINTFFHLFFPASLFWHTYQATYHESKEDCFRKLCNLQSNRSNPESFWISERPAVDKNEIIEIMNKFEGSEYKKFIYRTRLTISTFVTYLKSLHLHPNTDVFMFPRSIFSSPAENIAKIIANSNKIRIAIPIIVSHGGDNLHIVCVFIDKEKNTIQFFDSQGHSSKDRDMNSLALADEKPSNYSVGDFIENLADNLPNQNKLKISELSARCQFDSDQCGIFVSHAIQQFSEGKDLEDMVTTSGKMRGFSSQMVHTIIENHLSSSRN